MEDKSYDRIETSTRVESLPKKWSTSRFNASDLTERAEQQRVAAWLRGCEGIQFFATLGGEFASSRQRAKIVKMGYELGTPDLFIAEPRGKFHGLFVEMKRRTRGTLSEHQQRKLVELHSRGYCTAVCYGSDAAIETITTYLTQDSMQSD